jgi:hypothetical protein
VGFALKKFCRNYFRLFGLSFFVFSKKRALKESDITRAKYTSKNHSFNTPPKIRICRAATREKKIPRSGNGLERGHPARLCV